MGFIDNTARTAGSDGRHSLVCVGLDPEPAKFPARFVDDPDAVFAFCRDIVDATADVRLRVQAADRALRRAAAPRTRCSG